MFASKYMLTAVCGAMLASPVFAAYESKGVHRSTVRSDPDPTVELKEKAFRIDSNAIESEEWQEAIKRVLSQRLGSNRITLMRVRVDNATAKEKIQAKSSKLNSLTERILIGGGTYLDLGRSQFLVLDHVFSSRRRNGRDPVLVGALSHGITNLWVDVPPAGTIGVVGDIILSRCPSEDMGTLAVKIKAPRALHDTRLTIGPVAVGGPYGDTHSIDTGREFQLPLAPGKYKILLPDFDLKASRWEVEIEAQNTTRLDFVVSWQVEKTKEDRAPLAPQKEPN